MKYSLRSLMIVMTLLCVLLGGRIEYLRQMAAYHEREAYGPPNREGERIQFIDFEHLTLAERYRNAMTRPWTIVDQKYEPEWARNGVEIYYSPKAQASPTRVVPVASP